MEHSPIQKAIPEKKTKVLRSKKKTEDDPLSGEQKGTSAEMICVLVPVSSHPVAEFQDPPNTRDAMLWLGDLHKVQGYQAVLQE